MLFFLRTNLKHIIKKYGDKNIEKSQIPLFTHENKICNYPSKYMKSDYGDTKSYLIVENFYKPIGMFITQPKIDKIKLAYPIVRHFEIFKKQCKTNKHYGTKSMKKLIRKYKKFVLQAHNSSLVRYYEKFGFKLFSKCGNILVIDKRHKWF